ncbi:MAG: PD40 domain-containing protein [Bacteroidales bacterium]|nr:PD40 domain-containing protein [Bacteroidales bacterium]
MSRPSHNTTALIAATRRALLAVAAVAAVWQASAQFNVTHLKKPYNTPGSETGAIMVGDTVLLYASTQELSTNNRMFRYNPRVMQLVQARHSRSGRLSKPIPNRWNLNNSRYHTGNAALDPATGDLYFTRADIRDTALRSQIYVARRQKRQWLKPEPLGGDINMHGYTATHPAVERVNDSTLILYFVSDRPGGVGGLDIWYSLIVAGRPGVSTNLGMPVNTPFDEITPFYDNPNHTLYYSSDRPGGAGGFDIYYSHGSRNTWVEPAPICHCMQSAYNDIYFTITRHVGQQPVEGYLSSNREDSYFVTDSTCCNDLYHWALDTTLLVDTTPTTPPPPDTAGQALARADSLRRLLERLVVPPLPLYFHNDEPNPRSRATTTTTAYAQCYQSYTTLRQTYIDAQPDSAREGVAHFFDHELPTAYARLDSLVAILADSLEAGRNVTLVVGGYASPRHTSAYNRRLSQRRIATLLNHLRQWRDGQLEDFIDDGQLSLEARPDGSDHQTVAPGHDPIFSLDAMRARRIEITHISITPRTAP